MRLSWIFLIIGLVAGCASAPPPVQVAPPPPILAKITAPPAHDRALLLDHKYFTVFYSPTYKLAKYVRYTLTAEQLRARNAKRSDRFFPDPQLAALNQPGLPESAYKKSGYDKGHLAPAEDFTFSEEAVDETFVLTNVAPQKPSLNRGPWKRLENRVRRWACGEGKITVYSGPILEPGLQKTKSGLPIPKEYFKLVVDETPPVKQMAFILKQTDRGDVVDRRVVSVNELQARINEVLVFDAKTEEARKPAQVNTWAEKDCDPTSPAR